MFSGEILGREGILQPIHLVKAKSIPIKRHVKIRSEANPYDPEWETYFEKRLDVKMVQNLKGKRTLLLSGNNKTASVLSVTARSLNSQDGIATTLSGEATAAEIRQTIASFSTQNATKSFTAKG